MRGLVKALRRCNAIISWAVKAVVIVSAMLMVATICWQVFMRYAFNQPPSWTEEFALLLFSWTMLLMLALGVREAFHVRMDVLIERLPAHARHLVESLIAIATIFFGIYLAISGVNYVREMYGSTSAAMAYPIALLYSAAPVCGCLICLYSLERLLSRMDPERGI